MEFILIALAAVGVGAVLFWDQAQQRGHVAQLRESWAGRTVTIPPIGTICHGDLPPMRGALRVFGALALVDGALTFTGHRDPRYDFTAPVASIRWIGLRARYKITWNRRIEQPELIVHADDPRGWQVYTFTEGPLKQFAEQLGAQAGLAVHEMGEQFEDFGPEPAVRLVQNADGSWQRITPETFDPGDPPADWDGWQSTLYLTPDRLLYGGQHPIPLAAIHRVDLYPAGRLNPFDQSLLKIEYTDENGGPRAVGFLVPSAGDWTGVIEQRVDVPVMVHGGRREG